ncbi:MAG: hypothetical protein R3E64_03140 [Halioglobus sp.]
MNKVLSLLACALLPLQAIAEPVIYYCNIFTQLPGAPDSPVFRFEVEGSNAILTYTYRARPGEEPQNFKLLLQVLNDSDRSLVLGKLTEGNEQRAPRYDVWVLDKQNMHLRSEVTRATDQGRQQQRSGTCIIDVYREKE